MSKFNKTALLLVLDASGSMSGMKDSVVTGLNEYIQAQKAIPNSEKDLFWIVSFNNTMTEIVPFQKMLDVSEFSESIYVPRGGTAYYDCLSSVISQANIYFSKLPKRDQPKKIMCVTFTDGQENASKETTKSQLNNMIKNNSGTNGIWDFIFIGSNFDVDQESSSLGVSQRNTMSYQSTAAGASAMFNTLRDATVTYKSSMTREIFVEKEDSSK